MKIGKYEIEDELGHGSMGVVYRARDTLLDRYVAVKLISTSALDDWSRTLFEREAKAVARLSHPNIIVVHDFDYFEKQPYIVMELLKGASLEDLAIEKRLPIARALENVYQVLNGLEHAHRQGVIHRDIKPTNIFVTESNVVKIMDFGIARLAESASTATKGFVLGTPEYMSPEQVQAESLDGRTDLFSVGTMLYWLLADETPFSADTANSTMYRVVNDEPSPLQLPGISPQVHEGLQSILNRALAKEPADRYGSAAEMAKDVKKLIHVLEMEPEVVDVDLDRAETVQIPIKKFSTVRKTLHPESSVRIAEKKIQTAAEPTGPKTDEGAPPIEVERTMHLQPPKERSTFSPRTIIEVPPTAAIRRFSKRNIAIALTLLLAAAWGVYRVMAARMIPQKTPAKPTAAAMVQLNLACSRENVRWANHFIKKFSQTASGKKIHLNVVPESSAVGDESIFGKTKGYQVWWPPSALEADLLPANQRQNLAGGEKPIALTPMVFVIWKDRYDAIQSKYKTVNFYSIVRALQQESGWKGIANQPDWGRFTFGFTDPRTTNGGVVMLLLMAHEYLNKDSALSMSDIQNPGLKVFLTGIKKKGKIFKASTSELMEEMIRKGPGSYDAAFVYENLAIDYLKDARDRWGDYQVIYPIYNYWNENPLYVFKSSWISSDQKKAADQFRDFLLSEDIQKDSLDYGFRPASTSVPVGFERSPLLLNKDLGFRVDIGPEVEDSSPEVVRGLLDLWDQL